MALDGTPSRKARRVKYADTPMLTESEIASLQEWTRKIQAEGAAILDRLDAEEAAKVASEARPAQSR